MKTTIEAMKQIRDKLIKGDLLCEVVAVSMLDDTIRLVEEQSGEPVGCLSVTQHNEGRSYEVNLSNGMFNVTQCGEHPLFTHHAPAKTVELAALILQLRAIACATPGWADMLNKSAKAFDAYGEALYELVDCKIKLSRIEAVMRGEE